MLSSTTEGNDNTFIVAPSASGQLVATPIKPVLVPIKNASQLASTSSKTANSQLVSSIPKNKPSDALSNLPVISNVRTVTNYSKKTPTAIITKIDQSVLKKKVNQLTPNNNVPSSGESTYSTNIEQNMKENILLQVQNKKR